MNISFRSVLTVGVATITATAIAFGPSVQEPTPAASPAPVVQAVSPPIKLTAQVQPLAAADLPNLLVGWLERIIVPPSASQPVPMPPSGLSPAPTSVAGTLEWAYHAVEPWVRYGFEVATYAVGWVPYVGWLSGQIMIFYNFGERIVHAIAHNTLDWLNGNGSFLFNLSEGIAWTIDAFIQLGIDEWNYWLPPLPPLPPFPFAAAATTATENPTTLAAADVTQPNEKRAAVKGEDVAEAPDANAAGTADQTTVKETREPKAPKEPKSSTKASLAAEDNSEPNQKVSATDKKADKGPKGDSESSAPAKKNDTDKKDGAGKKE